MPLGPRIQWKCVMCLNTTGLNETLIGPLHRKRTNTYSTKA